MIASVAGAIASPMPAPMIVPISASGPSPVSTPNEVSMTSAPATVARPDATASFVPARRASTTDSRDPATMPAAIGSIRRPASSALWPSTAGCGTRRSRASAARRGAPTR
jgi:hypothetical protein